MFAVALSQFFELSFLLCRSVEHVNCHSVYHHTQWESELVPTQPPPFSSPVSWPMSNADCYFLPQVGDRFMALMLKIWCTGYATRYQTWVGYQQVWNSLIVPATCHRHTGLFSYWLNMVYLVPGSSSSDMRDMVSHLLHKSPQQRYGGIIDCMVECSFILGPLSVQKKVCKSLWMRLWNVSRWQVAHLASFPGFYHLQHLATFTDKESVHKYLGRWCPTNKQWILTLPCECSSLRSLDRHYRKGPHNPLLGTILYLPDVTPCDKVFPPLCICMLEAIKWK